VSFFRTRKALSGISEYTVMPATTSPPPPPPPPPPKARLARAQRALARTSSFGSLGADEPEMTEAQWRAAMLASQREVTEWQKHWVKRDEFQRWMQLGATLAIPLSAAIWRAIFRAGRGAAKK